VRYRGPTNLREQTRMATSASPAAAVNPTATAVFHRPSPWAPRRPVATSSTQPHAHIGRRCPLDRSTATLRCYLPPPPLPSIERKIPASPFSFYFSFSLSAWGGDFRGRGSCRRAVRHVFVAVVATGGLAGWVRHVKGRFGTTSFSLYLWMNSTAVHALRKSRTCFTEQ
jgi:hypothetical protein